MGDDDSSVTPSGRLLDAAEVAGLLNVTKSWVYEQTRQGRIPHVRLGRYVRYRSDAINAWLLELERSTGTVTTLLAGPLSVRP